MAVRRVRGVAVEDVQGSLGEVDVGVEDEHEVDAYESCGVVASVGPASPHHIPVVRTRAVGHMDPINHHASSRPKTNNRWGMPLA